MPTRNQVWFAPALAAIALALAVPASGAGASSAAASPVTFHLEFPAGTSGTFTATGPVCPSGTISVPQLGQGLTKVLACDDGSGSFALHLHGPTLAASSAPSEWRTAAEYATGAYVAMRGSGTVTGGTCRYQAAPCDADLQGEVVVP
jgi:hypothetical protein